MMKSLIAYVSYSGNTEEIAEILESYLLEKGLEVDRIEVSYLSKPLDLNAYDLILLGSFTWDYGSVPDEMEAFLQSTSLPNQAIAIFGSGDTQFGSDALYCRAVDLLVDRFESQWRGLKIEQSPRGEQEWLIKKWIKQVLRDVKVIKQGQNFRTPIS